MTTISQYTPATAVAPARGDGEALWFLGMLPVVKADHETPRGAVAVIEHRAPRGAGPPLHVHRREDESFYVIEGELTFWVGGDVIHAPAGSFVHGPRDLPHTFVVSSGEARFLLVTEPSGLERFMRPLFQPAARAETPAAPTAPPDTARLGALAAEHGIEILGPPGIPA